MGRIFVYELTLAHLRLSGKILNSNAFFTHAMTMLVLKCKPKFKQTKHF